MPDNNARWPIFLSHCSKEAIAFPCQYTYNCLTQLAPIYEAEDEAYKKDKDHHFPSPFLSFPLATSRIHQG